MLEKPVSPSKFWLEMVAAKWQIVAVSSEERATSDRFLTRLRALLFFASFFVLSRALRLFAHEGRCENTCRSFCSVLPIEYREIMRFLVSRRALLEIERREEARGNYFVHFFRSTIQIIPSCLVEYIYLYSPFLTLIIYLLRYRNIIFIHRFNFILSKIVNFSKTIELSYDYF